MLSCPTPPSASLQARFAPPLHTPNLGVMVDWRHLHGQAVGVREVHTVRTARTVWLESLTLELFYDGIRAEILDRDAEVIEPRRLVLEEREEVLSQAEEAVRLRFVDDG